MPQLPSAVGVLALLLGLCLAVPLDAAEYYVSPDGDDANPGTKESPFATVARGQEAAEPGDTVWIGGGEYVFEGAEDEIGILFDKSGEEDNRINYWAVPGENPVFDFFNLETEARLKGFSVTGSWLHFKGLELRGIQQIITNVNESWCIRVEQDASHNIFEQLNLHHNEGPGLFIADRAAHNLVLNCDSHHNHDPDRGGENADGFGSHSTQDGNVFRGCRAWFNSDDGYDLINSPGEARIENCWAWRNGFVPDTDQRAGNGAGIKAGGFGLNPERFPEDMPRHVVTGSLAFENRAQGFYANHHPGGLTWYNNTSFNNPRGFDMLADQGPADHLLRNNLSFRDGDALARETGEELDAAHNSWSMDVEVTAEDFRSVDPAGVDGPRQEDGSLPAIDFMKLAEGSDLIDAGVDVGLPFNGKAPDLGAFETE